jgi:hypothetical protein
MWKLLNSQSSKGGCILVTLDILMKEASFMLSIDSKLCLI